MTNEQIAAALEVCRNATPGPWEAQEHAHANPKGVYRFDIRGNIKDLNGGRFSSTPVCQLYSGFVWFEGDAEFLVATRDPATGYEAALTELQAARENIAALQRVDKALQSDSGKAYLRIADLEAQLTLANENGRMLQEQNGELRAEVSRLQAELAGADSRDLPDVSRQ